MLPNEIIDKIFKYRYQNFKIFLSKMRKINQEYRNKYYSIISSSGRFIALKYKKSNSHFYYNRRGCGPHCNYCQKIFNPKSIKRVGILCKNYYYQKNENLFL